MKTNPGFHISGFKPPYAPAETPVVIAIETPETRTPDGYVNTPMTRTDIAAFANGIDAVCFARELADLFEKYGGAAPGVQLRALP